MQLLTIWSPRALQACETIPITLSERSLARPARHAGLYLCSSNRYTLANPNSSQLGGLNDLVNFAVFNCAVRVAATQWSADASSAIGEKISDARQSETAGKMREKTSGIRERVQNEVKNEDGMLNKIKNNVTSGVEKVGKKVDEKIVNRDK